VRLALLAIWLLAGCAGTDDFHQYRVRDWGEHYFDRTRDYNNTEASLDLDGLATLFGPEFVERGNVPFGRVSYAVSGPSFVGSFNNATFGFEFNVGVAGDDVLLILTYDEQRSLRSVTYRLDQMPSSGIRQLTVSERSRDAAILLGRQLRQDLRRRLPRDGGDHWGLLPNFAEKFVIAVDNHVWRER